MTQHAPLPAPGTTTYTFLGNPPAIFADGRYTVTNMNYQQWNWFNEEDHTVGDTNGRMLLVNASFTPGEFYRLPIAGLCENTTYTFSSWVKNLTPRDLINGGLTPNPCNVRFEIWDSTDTVLLKSGNTIDFLGALSTENGEWLQFGLLFQTQPGQNSVILKMVNNGLGGYGNDLAIDDIEFKSCGDDIKVEDAGNNNSILICSSQTPYSTTLTATPDNSVFTTHFYQWEESPDRASWTDVSGELNQSISIAPINTTTYFRAKIAEDIANVNVASCNTLSDVFQITVNPTVVPTFTPITPICSGDTLSALPTTSNNGITGMWSPTLDNTTTTIYTFTPATGQCGTTQTLTITVNPNITPTFTSVTPICNGDALSALPTTSNNGITGTWAPALDNTATTTYTFTPDTGQCATTQTLTITVNPNITPTFDAIAPICNGETLSPLPTTSNESITGTWSPALNNTTTTTYTFTPDTGQCATSQMMTITVNPITASTFTQVSAICNGDTLSALPTTSNEGITGVWNPALDNTTTMTYTFTPDIGQCATSQMMTITVNPMTTSTFTQVSSICSGDSLLALPTTSNEGITGMWSPALDNTITTTYTFTPDAGQCAGSQMMTITVNPITTPTFTQVSAICNGDALATLPTTSNEGITGTWTPALDNTTTTTYTFTSGIGQCALNQTMTITVNPIGTPTFNQIPAICSGDTLSALPTTSNEGITGMWSPALDNTITTTYIFTPDPQFCPSQVSLTIDVFENPIFSLQNEYFLCFDLNAAIVSPITIDTGLNTTMYNFTWLLNGVIIAGANHGTYIPITGGNYEVIVQNLSTMCSKMVSTLVTVLTEPNFEADVTTDAFTKNQTIEITTISIGDFEYQLDAASWQDEPIFNNVSIGEHIVTVRDKRGCIESSRTVFIIGYPKYFTPNGDGYNETWNIVGPTSPINSLASAEIYIYNRYGKLLKQINPTGEGWNGVYNGVKMSSDDYWFIVEYNEPNSGERKEFKAHFALKR